MALFDIFKRFTSADSQKIETLEKGSKEFKTIRNKLRPEDENTFFSLNRTQSWGTFDSRVTLIELYQLSVYSDILQNVFNTLRNEMFRRGFEQKALTTFENELQLNKIKNIESKANYNGQTLKEVFMELENDLNIADDAYIFARKEYKVNGNNEIVGGEVLELLRVDPLSVEILFDSMKRLGRDDSGEPIYVDPENRGETCREAYNANGIKNLKACYKVKVGTSGNSESSYQYYDTSEILHVSKYRPTKTYGFSPLYSLYNKVITLINMDYYIKQYYSGDKVPKGMLVVNTSNATGFRKFWGQFVARVRKNPHAINPLIHQADGSTDAVKWIDFMRNLSEMQYTEVRNEIRTQIGAVYNVSPIFQNDVSTGGGLNNEGLQITVTDRGTEFGQSIYNDKIIPWICEQIGVTDYEWKIVPSKEEDMAYEKDLRIKELEIAKQTAELGIKVTMNDTGEFSYSEGEVELQTNEPSMNSFFKSAKDINKKLGTVPPKQTKEVESALLNEFKKLLSKFDFKKKLSEKELLKKIQGSVKEFEKVLKSKSSKKINSIYKKEAEATSKNIGESFSIGPSDKEVIESLKRDANYQKAFEDLSEKVSQQLTSVIRKAYDNPEGFSMDQMVAEMKDTAEASEGRLRTIARTETTKISAAARQTQYTKSGADYKYFHIGPSDGRTTAMSKEIKKKTEKGVSWSDYVKIVKDVSKKHNPKWVVDDKAPISHPNTRHIFIARRS